MQRLTITIALGLLLGAGCASQKGESVTSPNFKPVAVDKVAFVDVQGQVYGEPAKNRICDFYTMEFMRKGYAMISRAKVLERLEEEKALQASGITTDAQAAQAGKILNVPAVLMVNIPTYGEKMDMTAKLIDVETVEVLWIGSGSATTGKTKSTAAGAILGAVLGAAVGGNDTSDRVAGGVIGGVVGGIAGHALSPEEVNTLQKLIKEKICVSLPARN